jgi:hypothetical protein
MRNLFDWGQSSIVKPRVPALVFVSIHYHQTIRASEDYPAESLLIRHLDASLKQMLADPAKARNMGADLP